MKVLFAVWELDPFFKVGGLGDVARSLPNALNHKGVDIRCIIPFYDAVRLGGNRKNMIKNSVWSMIKEVNKQRFLK